MANNRNSLKFGFMNTFCLQILFFSISTLLVVEDFQYLFEKGISKSTQHEFALDDFCDDGEEEAGSKSQKEESGSDEIKKKDERAGERKYKIGKRII